MPEPTTEEEPFNLPPAKASALVGLSADTLADYAQKGLLPVRLTPGGHRRYRRSDVLALLSSEAVS